MPRRSKDAHLLELARRGAEVRLRELVQEVKNIIGSFPNLRESVDNDELPLSFIIRRDARRADTPKPRRRRRPALSAAARKAIGQRMRKYWAARRKATKV